MTRDEAVKQAQADEKDVVLITESAKPPVAKIISFSKFKYQMDQKRAEGKKATKKQEIKELRFRPFMGQGDFDSRMKKVFEFLEDGDKVRPYVEFKGREITRKEFGFKIIERIIELTKDRATVEIHAKLLGKKLFLQLMPVKKKKITEPPAPTPTTA
jgi:translation initiation factor IF-3